ncbi:MAG: T9SS type A sorting domain-containing protein, partial [Bacteroidetes bacterium]|nr:T9SS type A sorting domain-containing protein [Bacteroidota bacterium]
KLGTFNYTYTVLDESGNSSFVEFTIEVVDTEKPVISLIGGSVVNLCRYKELAKNEYSIDDNYDTGLMLDDDADGTYFSDYMVNKYWGFYTIIYNTEDISGNKADEVVRFVNVQECSWNGVEESGLAQYIEMYPNPTKGEFYISVELPQSENLLIKVSNMLGDELEIITKSNTQGGMFKVDLGAFADGVYFVQVQTDEASTVQKVTLAK